MLKGVTTPDGESEGPVVRTITVTQVFQVDTEEPFFVGQVLQVEVFTGNIDLSRGKTISTVVVLVGSGTAASMAVIPPYTYKTNYHRRTKKI